MRDRKKSTLRVRSAKAPSRQAGARPPGASRDLRVSAHVRREVRNRLLAWGKSHYAKYPWREEKNPWIALSTEVLLQRTRASQVIPVYQVFRKKYATPSALAAASEGELSGVVGSLGLHWRTPLLIKMASIVAEHGLPGDNFGDLQRLPGVGPYAAAAYLSMHRGVRATIVDANVVRWLGRLFGVETNCETRRKRWFISLADALTPRRTFRDYNYAVLDFAMQLCSHAPKCDECPFATDLCRFAKRDPSSARPSSKHLTPR